MCVVCEHSERVKVKPLKRGKVNLLCEQHVCNLQTVSYTVFHIARAIFQKFVNSVPRKDSILRPEKSVWSTELDQKE